MVFSVAAAFIFLAAAGERVSEWLLKPLIMLISSQINKPELQPWWDYVERIVCAIPGFAWVMLVGLDLFAELGLMMPYSAGVISTAVIVGGGANIAHDILGMIPQSE